VLSSDTDFAALKLMARIRWMINFETVATVGNDEDAPFIPAPPRVFSA
jgi:hypothetical protein